MVLGMADARDPLLPRIEYVLDLYGVSATAFSYAASGDPALVRKIRDGRFLKKPALRERVETVLSLIEQKGKL